MKTRAEIEERYKWDLTKFCKNNEDFYSRLEKLKQELHEFKKYEGKLKTSDKLLFECLEKENEFFKELGFLYVYASLYKKGDNACEEANEMYEKINLFCTQVNIQTVFIGLEIAKFPSSKLKELQNDKLFKNYARMFERILRRKKHFLSKKEEIVLTKISEFTDGFSENFDKFADVDLEFGEIEDGNGKKHTLNQSNYSLYVESKDRKLRENAFRRMNGRYGDFINTLANNYLYDIKVTAVTSKLRKYKSSLSRSIYKEEASEKTYKLLIKKVRENVKIVEDFFEIKRKMLKLDKIAIYDTFAPIVNELDYKFTYDEAIELIKKALTVLGDDYVKLIDRAKNERWIDVMPNKNKDSGAFSWGTYGATPVVLTNFEGNLESVFTLAHELGHAMHTYYSNSYQPIQTAGYTIFVAEVASTTNEMLLLNYLLKNAKTDKEKIYYYNHFLVQVRSTIFRQTMFSEFEDFAYSTYEAGTPLTRQLMCSKYYDLNKFYYGKDVELIDEIQYEWARIPHFYSPFYVYKYATGLICAINISTKLLSDNKNMLPKYKKFLSSGSIKSPIALLKECDCDLEQDKIYDDVFKVCQDYIVKWKELI